MTENLDELAARCIGQPAVGYPLSNAEAAALIERVRAAEADRDAYRARIDAVRALADSWVPLAYGTRRNGHAGNPVVEAMLNSLRAALGGD